MDRRALLGKLFPVRGGRVLPPYTDGSTDFSACEACAGDCVTACASQTGVLRRDAGGHPYLDFREAGCTFCQACLEACPYQVIGSTARRPLARVQIDPAACLAHQGTFCVACQSACPEDAVRFERMVKPWISDRCTGCGLCVAPCPTGAVRVEALL